ncbi:MAG: hypothetical protein P4L39_09690 [Humidesulfovibrio sp.]|nr:hypothetical protein [Humidesulfovibrio sp.]
MSEKQAITQTRKRALKLAKGALLVLAALLVLGAALVLALPMLLSSDFARARVTEQLAKATGKPAHIRELAFGWSDGLRLRGLGIGQGELSDPNFLASIDSLHAGFSLPAVLRGDIRLSFELRGLRLHVPPKSEPEPPAKPLAEVLQMLFSALRAGAKPVPVKLDAHVTVDLADMAVRLEPAPGGKAVELRDLYVRLDAPSLKSAPMTLTLGTDLYTGQERVAPLRVETSVAGLVNATGHIAPAQALLTARVQAPGVLLTAGGSLATTLKINLRAQLREALAPARALAAKPLPDVDGTLTLALNLSQSSADRLHAGLRLSADAVRAAGIGGDGGKGGKSVGPLSLNLSQDAEIDLAAQTMRLPGKLEIKPESQARWLAELTGVSKGKPHVVLSIKPLHLALGGLLPALHGLLPQGVGLGSATLDVASIDAATDIPAPGWAPQAEARVLGLDITAKNITRSEAAGAVSIDRLGLRMDAASVRLSGSRPGKNGVAEPGPATGPMSGLLEASFSVSVDGLRQMSGGGGAKGNAAPQMSVRQINLPRASVHVDGLALEQAALFGLTGKVGVEMEAQAKDLEVRGKAQIPALFVQMRLNAGLPKAKSAAANLEAFDLAAPLVRVLSPGKKPIEAPLTLRASAPDIRLTSAGGLPGVKDMRVDLDLGAALRGNAQVSLAGTSGRTLRTDGRVALDTGKLLGLAAPFAPRQAKASGALALDWKLAATLPESQAPTKAGQQPAKPQKLSQTIKGLGYVSKAEAVLNIAGVSLDWPLAAKPGQAAEVLRLRGISTPRPLRLTTRDGAKESTFKGSLAFGPMDALPGVGRLATPLRGLVTVNAAQQGARSVQLSEVLHLDGFALDQNLALTVDKLDKVLDRDADRLAAVLELADGQASFSLTTGDLASALAAKRGGKGVTGKGRLEAGAEARLSGGRSLALSARLLSPGLDLTLGPDTAITDLTSNVRLARRYSLAPGLRCPDAVETELTPLSEQVFNLFSTPQSTPTASEALGQLLRTEAPKATGGTFGLARLKLKSGGLPLDIRDVELRLDDSGPVPGLRSFRAGLLGGNVLGSAMIRKNAGRYSLIADMAFTGIDPARLFPAKGPKDQPGQAETSGRVRLETPLTADPEALLQQLNFRADITRIGPRTLERMLYALDPEEQNETIVQQRRLMAIGYPRFLRVAAAYGNMSVSGAVDVKGFQLDLPQLDRLGIANLPLRKQLTKPLATVPTLIKALDAASGSRICRDPADALGVLRIVQPAATQGAPQ